FVERPHLEQAVDEDAITLRRRHTSGGGVRCGEQADLLEVGHDVADRRRTDVETGIFCQGARAHRPAVGNVLRDRRAQQLPRAGIEWGSELGSHLRTILLRRLLRLHWSIGFLRCLSTDRLSLRHVPVSGDLLLYSVLEAVFPVCAGMTNPWNSPIACCER